MGRLPELALGLALIGSACVGFSEPGPECRTDADCAGECTNLGECVASGTSLAVRIHWTIAGVAPSPKDPRPCSGVGELEVSFYSGGQNEASYRPVTCSLGQIYFDRLPPYVDSVAISAYSESGGLLDRVDGPVEPSGETALDVDLQL